MTCYHFRKIDVCPEPTNVFGAENLTTNSVHKVWSFQGQDHFQK